MNGPFGVARGRSIRFKAVWALRLGNYNPVLRSLANRFNRDRVL